MQQVLVSLGTRSYPILIKNGLLKDCGQYFLEHMGKSKVAVITDSHVAPLYLDQVLNSLQDAGLSCCSVVLPAGEKTKCAECLMELYAFFSEHGISRTDAVIALGGGVIGDLAGFAAATWMRGIRYCQIPTTLLAQVDSSVGGKVAIDLPQGKNLVGAFHQPSLVLCDPEVLNTLPDEFWCDGLGEVVKYGCIHDEALFSMLEEAAPYGRHALMKIMETILEHCIGAKAEIVSMDELDTGLRMTLNFGHTLAHAIETCQHYEGLHHGQAVSIGMYAITSLSEAKGITQFQTTDRLVRLLKALGLPWALPDIPGEQLMYAMQLDKKHTGSILHMIVLDHIGSCHVMDASPGFFAPLFA